MTCTDPPLTTVRQPIEMMGQAAVDLLVNQIEGTGVQPDELLFEPELVVRGSTGTAAGEGRLSQRHSRNVIEGRAPAGPALLRVPWVTCVEFFLLASSLLA